jgi:uncharacterized membrane protein YuzA (DUF378 family)
MYCKEGSSKKMCLGETISRILVIVGGLNWGLVGIGMLFGKSWNLVNLLLGSVPMVEAIVYLLVGIAAFILLFSCKCTKCGCGAKPEIFSNQENTNIN